MAGIALTDRKLGAEVRRLGLKKLKVILEDENHEKYSKEFQQQILLKLASTLLPRINEHTGENGGEIKINLMNYGDTITLPVHATTLSNTISTSDGQGNNESDINLEPPFGQG